MWTTYNHLAHYLKLNRANYEAKDKIEENWLRIRASQLSETLSCQMTQFIVGSSIESPRTEAGSLAHKHSENKIIGEGETDLSIDSYVKTINKYKKSMSLWGLEVSLSRPIKPLIALTGTCDFIGVRGSRGYIFDLKTGDYLVTPDNNRQLLAYGWMLKNYLPHIDNFWFGIFQNNKLKIWKTDLKRLNQFEKEISKLSLNVNFTTGYNCFSCFKQLNCPVGRGLAQGLPKLHKSEINNLIKTIDKFHILKYQLNNELLDHKDKELNQDILAHKGRV